MPDKLDYVHWLP